MKNYLVVGKPINHSLSPNLHNYWINKHKIKALYKKKELSKNELKDLIKDLRNKEIAGANITVPFKKEVIPYIDELTTRANITQSVNTLYLDNEKIVGDNTDIEGFEKSIHNLEYDLQNKKVFIIGSGGVVSSIIYALNKNKSSKISVTNRTREKADNLKIIFKDLHVVNWGTVPDFDLIINATSVGLNKDDFINLDLSKSGKNKLFYDVIYNPRETNFLKMGKNLGNVIENGKMMFIYQALAAFKIWHGIEPRIDAEVIKLFEK